MTYDDELADRVRERVNALHDVGPVQERAMFGGLAFMVRGHMTLAASGEGGLMVRVSTDDLADLIGRDHIEQVVMRGRQLKAWVRVDGAALTSDDDLAAWVERGVASARALPGR